MDSIQKFKKNNKDYVQKIMASHGGIQPVITVLVEVVKEGEKEEAIAVIPIPEYFFRNENTKDEIAELLPMIFDKMHDEGMKPLCVSWSSEAWLRKADKDAPKEILDNWRELPKEEVLFTSYESENESAVEIYTIHREGKIADENGNLIDAIRLETYDTSDAEVVPNPDGVVEGRFSNLFKKYVKKE